MIKTYQKLLRSNQVAGEVKHFQFFTEENVNGYMSKEAMLAYANSLTDLQRAQLDLFFEYTSAGFQITSLPLPSDDRETGEIVVWVTFKLPNTPQNFRMIYHPGILRFIKDCQQGKIKPSFTFDQLIEGAVKTEEQKG